MTSIFATVGRSHSEKAAKHYLAGPSLAGLTSAAAGEGCSLFAAGPSRTDRPLPTSFRRDWPEDIPHQE